MSGCQGVNSDNNNCCDDGNGYCFRGDIYNGYIDNRDSDRGNEIRE